MRKMSNEISGLLLLGVLVGCGGGGADMAASAPNMGGATPGGSQDVGYFRAQLLNGEIPASTDITLEGFISEHDIGYPETSCDRVLCLTGMIGYDRAVAEESDATLLAIGMASNVNLDERLRAPVNLAVVVDVSGSMSEANKLSYVKEGLALMVDELGPEDRLALVTYSSTARVVIPSTPVTDPSLFLEAISALRPDGSTNLYDGMVLGYEEVLANLAAGTIARVMLLSDGLANTGITETEEILAKSHDYVEQGIGLTTIGVGNDFNQDLMRALSEQAGGNFYYIEDPAKITTVFKDELDILVTPLAYNLRVRISIDPGFSFVDSFGVPFSTDEWGNLVLEVPTVFASRRGGAILLRLDAHEPLEDLDQAPVGAITYTYEPINDQGIAEASVDGILDVRFPTPDTTAQKAFAHDSMKKVMMLWNMVESFQAASDLVWELGDRDGALSRIEALASYVYESNQELEDEEITSDRLELIAQFAYNLGGYLDQPYYYDDGMPYYMDDEYNEPVIFACNNIGSTGPAWMGMFVVLLLGGTRRRRRG